MLKPELLDDLSNKIKDLFENSVAKESGKNLNALIQGAFTKMELVTREEFDVQAEVLRKTRAKLEALEQQLNALEMPKK